jgi:hypothetical protein
MRRIHKVLRGGSRGAAGNENALSQPWIVADHLVCSQVR